MNLPTKVEEALDLFSLLSFMGHANVSFITHFVYYYLAQLSHPNNFEKLLEIFK